MEIHKRLWNWCRRPVRPASTNLTRFVTPLFVSILIGGILLAAYATVSLLSPVVFFSSADSVKVCEWKDICHGVIAHISLATDAKWMTNRTDKITFLFAVENISGCPNATIYYNNSYVILNSVKLDPSYIDISESPFKKLSEREAWSVDWYFTPKGDDHTLACLGISKGKKVKYSLSLEVNYTVIDSKGVEWPGLFQITPPEPCLTVTIVGGEDAP